MPKELTHFLMAEKTAESVRETKLGKAAAANRNALLFGAIFPDILYYTSKPLPDGIASIPHRMHGKEGGLNFIRMQADLLTEQPDNDVRAALLLGMICHVSLDETMHPMVGYLTEGSGNKTAKGRTLATQRHRALESLMDMVLCPERIGDGDYRLKTIGGDHGNRFLEDLPMAALGEAAATTREEMSNAHRKCWRSYDRLQRLCAFRNLSNAAYAAGYLLPDKPREFITLLYVPCFSRQESILTGNIEFKHPATGQNFTETLSGLMDKAVAKTAAVAQEIEAALHGGPFPAELPNPGNGLLGELKFFAPEPAPRLF